MTIGVLAFQGDFAEHIDVLRTLKVSAIEVRSLEELSRVGALIIPGGESTVIAKFLWETGMGKEIISRVHNNSLCVFGTCAGAILLAKHVTGKNVPKSLGLLDITIDRNAYGTQIESFEASLKIKGLKNPLKAAFIRAPKITRVGKDVEVLASHKGVPVLVRGGAVMAATFHAEVRGETVLHELFLANVGE